MLDALTGELVYKDDDKEFQSINKVLNLINSYEDDKYVIFACHSSHELIEESVHMHNCLRMYHDFIVDGDSQIYFMREKNNINESLVDIEVVENKVVQALGKYNSECTEEQKKTIKKFEHSLVNFEIIGNEN